MEEIAASVVRTTHRRELADEWALVLASQTLHPRVAPRAGAFVLEVPAEEHAAATAVLLAWERENPPAPPVEPLPPPADVLAATAIFTALWVFFAITGPRDGAVAWFAQGSADADRILGGELWRTATALTLHADLGHLAGNTLAGMVFVSAVCGTLGFGAGAALVFASGVLGNLASAVFVSDHGSSVGASTSIFGAVGILAAQMVGRHQRRGIRGRRALAPLAAGLGLLAMLGTSERSDLSAHVFGLMAGALLGLLWVRAIPRPPGRSGQIALAVATLASLLACWAQAWSGSGPGSGAVLNY